MFPQFHAFPYWFGRSSLFLFNETRLQLLPSLENLLTLVVASKANCMWLIQLHIIAFQSIEAECFEIATFYRCSLHALFVLGQHVQSRQQRIIAHLAFNPLIVDLEI